MLYWRGRQIWEVKWPQGQRCWEMVKIGQKKEWKDAANHWTSSTHLIPTGAKSISGSLLVWILTSKQDLKAGVWADCLRENSTVSCVLIHQKNQIPLRLLKVRKIETESKLLYSWHNLCVWDFFSSEFIKVVDEHACGNIQEWMQYLPWMVTFTYVQAQGQKKHADQNPPNNFGETIWKLYVLWVHKTP